MGTLLSDMLIIRRRLEFVGLLLVLLGSFAADVLADDWPAMARAAARRRVAWTSIIESIPEAGLKVRWRARVGNGYSGPAVAAGRVFVTDHQFRSEV